MSTKAPRIVAELGRPETPDEEADRRAESRRLRRARQTARNLVYSLIVCVALVAGIVLLVPRGTPPVTRAVDYRSLAGDSQASVDRPLLAPAVPAAWRANAAELRSADGVTSWYVGFVTSPTTYLGYSEGLHGNGTWLADVLASAPAGGTTRIGGLLWRVYDQRDRGTAAGNVAYALATRVGDTYLAVYGTSSVAMTRSLAASLASEASSHDLPGGNAAP